MTRIDVVNKWLTAIQSVVIIAGVALAGWQLIEIAAQTKLQGQTLKRTQQTASATLVLQLRQKLDDSRYSKLTADIQSHDQNYPLLARADGGRGGKFREAEIEAYLGNFEDIGYLVQDELILSKMAYDHFSYDVEKAWCNTDIQRLIHDARKADKSSSAATDPTYGHFERLARGYLDTEGQTCKDLDNQ